LIKTVHQTGVLKALRLDHTSLVMVRRNLKYNFSKASKPMTAFISSFLKKIDQYGKQANNGSTYCVQTSETPLGVKLTVGQFVLLVFNMIDVFGRTCTHDCAYKRSIKDAESLFRNLYKKVPIDFRTRVVLYQNAQRLFESYKREYGLAQNIILESLDSKKAVSSAAVMLTVSTYMTRGFSDSNVLNVFQNVMAVLNGQQSIPDVETPASEMLSRCYQYFVDGVFDKEMAESEHYAVFILGQVFLDQLDPKMWRKVNPFRPMMTSATETLTLDEFGDKHLYLQTYTAIRDAFNAIDGSVGLAVHDTPWFMVHANVSTFLPDQPQKVISCGSEFAKCVVVTTPEALALWRKRVLIASCLTGVAVVKDVHTIVSALWDDQVTRFWLLNRLWSQTTQGSVAPREFLRPEHKHYEFFWCLMPVLARLDGKALAAAIAVGGVRYVDPEAAAELCSQLQAPRKALRTHRKAIQALGKGGELEPLALYALAMDARVNIEWRVDLVRLLTDSSAWPSGAQFTGVFVAKGITPGDRYPHVTDEVAQAAIDVVHSLTDKVDVFADETDKFAYPTYYNTEQNVVRLTNPLLIDVAYAYQAFETVKDERCVTKTQELPGENRMIRGSLEKLLANFSNNSDPSQTLPLQTPRTPSRPAFKPH
jgi:hypothetical protein